jgi:hypothetical protein
MVMGRNFSARNNRKFFQPDPNSARPEKCSGLAYYTGLLQRSPKFLIIFLGALRDPFVTAVEAAS